MAQPTPYKRSFSFTNAQEDDPDKPLPGPRLDIELDNIAESSEALTEVVNASQTVIDNMDAVIEVSENIEDVVFVSQNTQTYRDAVAFAPDLATAVDLFLGARTVDPSTGHNGDPLVVGATYYNLITGVTRVWNGTIWVDGVAVNMAGVVQGTHTIAGDVKSVNIGDFAYVTVSKNGSVLGNGQFSTASPYITIPSAVNGDVITWFGIARGGIQEGAMYVQSTVQAQIGQTLYSLDDDGQPLRLTQTNHALFYGGVDQRLMVYGDDYTIVDGDIVLAETPTVSRRMVVLAMPRFTNTEAQVILQEYKDAVQAILDQFQDITATATTLSSGQPATANFDPITGVLALGIPRGATGTGSGDMVASLYDPQNIEDDAFARENHTGTQAIETIDGLAEAILNSNIPLGWVSWSPYLRGFTPDGQTPSDGQLINRTEAPELVELLEAGALPVTTEVIWLADPLKRGCYTLGDGATTIRLPDYNGKQAGSLKGLFQRGDGIGGTPGDMLGDAIRNIVANMTVRYPSVISASGAFAMTGGASDAANALSGNNAVGLLSFDASRMVPTTDRVTGENRPVSVIGIWVIRTRGGTVRDLAPTAPAILGSNRFTGDQVIDGGLQVNGPTNLVKFDTAQSKTAAELLQARNNLGLGTAATRNTGTSGENVPLLSGANTWSADQMVNGNLVGRRSRDGTTGRQNQGGWHSSQFSTGYTAAHWATFLEEIVGSELQGVLTLTDGTSWKRWHFNNAGNGIAVNGSWINSSDERLKPDFTPIPDPVAALFELEGGTWHRLDTGSFGVGIKAQDAERAVPGSAIVTEARKELPDGTVIENALAIDTAGVGVAVLVEALKVAFQRIEALEAQLA